MTRSALAVIILVLAGCASWPLPPRPSATLLARADQLASEGRHVEALDAYDEILVTYPDTTEARHARPSRVALAELLDARARIAKLTTAMKAQEAELVRARGQIEARDGELTRARHEIQRLTAESERLRADLEQLKRIDLDLERRRR